MELYGIMHVEDDPDETERMAKYTAREEISYLSVSSLQALEGCLDSSNARVFVVDGRFPKVKGGPVIPLASEAIELIRSHYNGADIVLYSSEWKIKDIARKNSVDFISKMDTSTKECLAQLKERLTR